MGLSSIPRAGQAVWVKFTSPCALRLILGQEREFDGVLYNLWPLVISENVALRYH